ncbi:uncharacterized mitochondrial protein-like protein [Tanacetum coccineum]
MPLLPSPEPTVSYFDDLDYFKDFEKEFPAIVYNDAQTSKLDFLTEPTLSPQHIDEFNLKDETSLSKCDDEEQNVIYFNDLFPFNVIYLDDLKSNKDNDDDKIDVEHSSGDLSVKPLPNVINTDVDAYAHGTVDMAYLLNEYSVFDTGINTAYPEEWIRRINFLYSFRSISSVQIVVPQYDPHGSLICVPVKVLERKMVKVNNKLVVYMLIQWSNGLIDDATWELATDLEKNFLEFVFLFFEGNGI